MWIDLLALVASYLLGSIPFPYLGVKIATGKDLRQESNGNVGTRNAIRVAGLRWGLLVLALDMLKGALAYWLASRWGTSAWTIWLTPVALWAGHCFPAWLGFRGGVGLAALTGYLAAMWPLAALLGVPVFLVANRTLPWFNLAYALAFLFYLMATLQRGNDLLSAGLMVGLMLLAIAKKLSDMPRQKRIRGEEA